eukprot:9820127-Lingulodinium_polyedra.AAC.1
MAEPIIGLEALGPMLESLDPEAGLTRAALSMPLLWTNIFGQDSQKKRVVEFIQKVMQKKADHKTKKEKDNEHDEEKHNEHDNEHEEEKGSSSSTAPP